VVDEALNRPVNHVPVLGVILAGGASRRYGHDKALATLGGTALLQWVITRVQPQVGRLAISGTARSGFSLPVIADTVKDAGPLSALCSVLAWAEQAGLSQVVTFSCDTPFVPVNIVRDLRAALEDYDCAVASRAGAVHPTFTLWKIEAREKIETAFAIGVRSLHDAISYVDSTLVDFSAIRYGPGGDPFFNINSPGDMAAAQSWLTDEHQSR